MGILITAHNNKGFTIVEMAIVIVVIGILASVTVVGFGAWRTRTAENEVKSDLNGVQSAMENAKNFSTGYPSTIPSTFSASESVTVAYIRGTAKSFCVSATSKKDTTVTYYIDSSLGKEPSKGSCPSIVTNLIMNPSLESNTTTNISGYYSAPLSVDSTKAAFGTRSLKATTNSSANSQGMVWRMDGALPSSQYTCSVSLQGTTGKTVRVAGRAGTSTGGYVGEGYGVKYLVLSNSWQRVTFTYTTPSAAMISYLQVVLNTVESGVEIWGDGAMCVAGANAYTYADGNSKGWSWGGTANLSASSGPGL